MAHYRVPKLTNPNIVIRPARNQAEVEAANWLVFHNYVAEGYWDDDVKHVTENKWLNSPQRHVFVGVDGSEVVGTMSVIRDSAGGLPSDSFQPSWLGQFRDAGDHLGEGSALAVDKGYSGAKNLYFFLLKYYLQYSFYYAGIDRLVQACRPSHAEFYADVLRFEKNGGLVFNSYARQPGQLLSLDLVDAHRALSEHYEATGPDGNNLYRFLMVDKHPNVWYPNATLARPRHRDWVSYARLRGQFLPRSRAAAGVTGPAYIASVSTHA